MEIPTTFKGLLPIILAIGGIGGLIGFVRSAPSTIWRHIKHKFMNKITIYQTDEVYSVFNTWFYKNYSHKFTDIQLTRQSYDLPETDPNNKNLQFSQRLGYFFVKWNGSRFIVVKDRIERKESRSEYPYTDYYEIIGFKKSKTIEFISSLHEENINEKSQIKCYTNTDYGEWNFYQKLEHKSLSSIILPEGIKEGIIDDMEEFLKSKDWYLERSIPYSRGYLLHGDAGNGKTSTIISTAQHFNKNLYMLDLNSLKGDSELKYAFKNIEPNTIVSLEDVDKAFNQRKEGVEGISFSCLLNCLDGAFQKSGVIIFMTTNHIENLDSALIRDGRVDVKLEIKNPTQELVQKYVSRFYGKPVKLGNYDKGLCMAAVQGVCLKNKFDLEKTLLELT